MLPGWERKGTRVRKVGHNSFENVSSSSKTKAPIHVSITQLILYFSFKEENNTSTLTQSGPISNNYLAGVLGWAGPGWAATKGPMSLRGPWRCLKGWYSPPSVCGAERWRLISLGTPTLPHYPHHPHHPYPTLPYPTQPFPPLEACIKHKDPAWMSESTNYHSK